jgi:hypothetical protein
MGGFFERRQRRAPQRLEPALRVSALVDAVRAELLDELLDARILQAGAGRAIKRVISIMLDDVRLWGIASGNVS